MNRCICGHRDTEHDIDASVGEIDWCNVRGCPCQRFVDQKQANLFDETDFDEEERDSDDDVGAYYGV